MQVEYLKSWCGWSGFVNIHCQRPWAIKINGQLVRTKGGAIRTFGSKQAAIKWMEKNHDPVLSGT